MQKKLIALAVAGLMAAPVFAQSNVTVYGRIDMGYVNFGDSKTSGVDSRNAIDSGLYAPSYLGFKGVEDLGNGLKVGFDFQTRLNIDRNEQRDQVSSGSRRDAYLYVAGGFGTVAAGRLTTPQDSLLGSVDPMGSSVMAGYQLTYNQGANLLGANVTRLDNVLAYISPSFGGFKVTVAYTGNGIGEESNGNESAAGDARIWAISPVYSNGPLTVGLNYHRVEMQSTVAAVDGLTEKVWDVAAAYDFGVVKLSAAYGGDKLDNNGGDVRQWFVGASIPVSTAGKVGLVYGRSDDDDRSNAEDSRWAVGYTHDLSKRTMAYAQYGSMDIDSNSRNTGYNGAMYERALGVGLLHKF
ncbi:porin [Parazoarcus communis]|uniref:Porin n=1 Tax=Parazoarcus communis TaxID=41977 RepID=A0A2U8H329_9RHOO|nr:porin [Parazoarcus communis]AWI79576.1 porin [Parazoarcus communis]